MPRKKRLADGDRRWRGALRAGRRQDELLWGGTRGLLSRAGWKLKDIEVLRPRLDAEEPLYNEHLHFADCILHNRKPWPSGEAGLMAMHLAFKIIEELERFELNPAAGGPSPVASLWGLLPKEGPR